MHVFFLQVMCGVEAGANEHAEYAFIRRLLSRQFDHGVWPRIYNNSLRLAVMRERQFV